MSFNFSPKIVTDGLVLYLDAANNRSYSGYETTWNDLSKFGNNGTLTNFGSQTIYNSGSGGSIVFDGVDNYVDCGLSTFQPTQMTLSVWVSRTELKDGGIIVRGNVNETNTELGIAFGYTPEFGPLGPNHPAGYYIVGRVTSAYNQLLYPYPISSLNTFHNIVYTVVNNTSAALYYDGNLVDYTNTIGSISTNGKNLLLGKFNNYAPLSGKIANALIYDRALTSQEVLQNFNATKTRFGL